MNDEKFLITGGCGFVGSNLALNLKKSFPSCSMIALDNLKRRGSEMNISRLKDAGINFVHGDIRSKEDFEGLGEITTLIEAAAEPSVLSGINSGPDYVLNTNLLGTINCLNFAANRKAKFIYISTSRVYSINALNKINLTEAETRFQIEPSQSILGISLNGISEEFPVNGYRSIYGTSKLSSELLVEEYIHFYGLKAIINRCGVIAGPWQMGKVDQGVVALWMARHFWKQELSYIGFGGHGKQVRDVLHIDDLCSLIQMQLSNFSLFNGGTFNVGGATQVSVSLKELTGFCQAITGNKIPTRSINESHPADIPLYVSDNSKLDNLSGWKPKKDIAKILADIYDWIKNNERTLKPFLT